jgi:3-hydroxyisobutyrate dehydrogenase-like beta-hydroxyacid dehydrogenase
MKIGFIGIGAMGAAIVPNLVKAGHEVHVWNRSPEAAEALEGVTVLKAAEEAFQLDAVMTILANDDAVREVIISPGLPATARKDCVHVMMATISIPLVEELAKLHADAGIGYVSAPVFGTPNMAEAQQLNVVAAGDPATIDKVQPLLDAIGQKTWRVGDEPTHANVVKIAGNMMITLAIEAMGEATALTQSYGVSAATFLDILTNTLFASPSYKRYGGFIATDTYDPGFKLVLGLKDVNLALSAAEAKGTKLPAAEIVRNGMTLAVDKGWGSNDWSILAKIAQSRTSLKGSNGNGTGH